MSFFSLLATYSYDVKFYYQLSEAKYYTTNFRLILRFHTLIFIGKLDMFVEVLSY